MGVALWTCFLQFRLNLKVSHVYSKGYRGGDTLSHQLVSLYSLPPPTQGEGSMGNSTSGRQRHRAPTPLSVSSLGSANFPPRATSPTPRAASGMLARSVLPHHPSTQSPEKK